MVRKSKVTPASELLEKHSSKNTAQGQSGGNQQGDQEHNPASHLNARSVRLSVRSQFNKLSQPSDQCWALICRWSEASNKQTSYRRCAACLNHFIDNSDRLTVFLVWNEIVWWKYASSKQVLMGYRKKMMMQLKLRQHTACTTQVSV